MHETSIFWLRVAAVLYAVGLAHAIATILRKDNKMFRVALPAFRIAVALHAVAIVELARAIGHFPADNFYETISLCGFFSAVLFLLVYWRYRFESLSLIFFPAVFLMTLIGATEVPVGSWTSTRVRDAWLLVHVGLVVIGYVALLLTAVGSLFYLVQERRLKRKQPRNMLEKLPPLGTLDSLISRSMATGFVFITLSLIAGTTWAFIESGTRWIGEPKIAVSLLTWVFYLVMVFLRVSAGWRGRRAAVMALTVLCFSALTWAAHVGLKPLLVP
jgi:ABC-type uncharacterized transport system permease subunit